MYLDSAIFVKILTVEPDSDFFQNALAGELLLSSELASTEVFSALLAKERAHTISKPQREKAWETFRERLAVREIVLHPLDSRILTRSRHVLESCHPAVPLRTLDAIHVASCDLNQSFPLCSTDQRMRDAAKKLSIPFFP